MLHEVEELRRSLIIKIQNVQTSLYTVKPAYALDFDFIVSEAIDLDQTAQQCSSCHHAPRLAERLELAQSLINEYQTSLSYYLTAAANSGRIAKIKSDAAEIGKKLIMLTGEMSHTASRNLAELSTETMLRMSHVMTILLITIATTFLLGVMVAVNLTKSITKPVSQLVNATRMIASGEYGTAIDYRDKTEFGELAEHFNSMSRAIKDGYDKIQKEMADRKQAEEALRESEVKFRTFFEVSPVGIVIYPVSSDPFHSRLERATFNSAYHTFFGYSREELNSKSIADLTYPDDMDKHADLTHDLLVGTRDSYNLEVRFMNKKEDIIWGYLNVTALRNSHDEPAQIMTTLVDINERKTMEMEQLKFEKLESVGILAGGIAHDFNNILTSIIVNIARAKMSHNFEKLFEVLEEVEGACTRAKELTNRLITFSKGGSPVMKPVLLNEHVKESALFALKGSHIECNFSLPDDLWPVEADAGQINQVILNLVINAVQAMPSVGTIHIALKNVKADAQNPHPLPDGDFVRVLIQDSGSGISKKNIQKIFDPYFTTKQEGSGLGLSSAYSIIKNHGGYIYVDSEKGFGSTFTIYLPAVRDKLPHITKRKAEDMSGEGKILLMDDDSTLRSTLSKTLRQFGYDVEVARDGDEAIALYETALKDNEPFDAVIMDLTISSGMGGEEAIQKLRAIDPEVKAIVSSGYSDESVMSDFKKYGFSGTITKPYEIEELNDLLNSLITENA
jgi:PAS domain S-box-containing protein